MTTEDFEIQIKKDIDSDLNIRVNPNAEDIAGVYWNDIYIGVAVPPKEIRKEHSSSYTDSMGHPYRHIALAIEFIEAKLPKYKKAYEEEPELFVDEKE